MEILTSRGIVEVGGRFLVTCIRPDGSIRWQAEAKNLVVDEGLNYILDSAILGNSPESFWYIGLTAASPTPASDDTMSSHSGWTEFTDYSEAARQDWTATRTNQTVSNSASKAEFSINADGSTIGGAFLVSSSTKGGTTGTLLCVAAFSGGNKSADSGDTLRVQYDFSAADDGA